MRCVLGVIRIRPERRIHTLPERIPFHLDRSHDVGHRRRVNRCRLTRISIEIENKRRIVLPRRPKRSVRIVPATTARKESEQGRREDGARRVREKERRAPVVQPVAMRGTTRLVNVPFLTESDPMRFPLAHPHGGDHICSRSGRLKAAVRMEERGVTF